MHMYLSYTTVSWIPFPISCLLFIQISEDEKKIRRRADKPIPEFNKERKDDLKKRSIYAVSTVVPLF